MAYAALVSLANTIHRTLNDDRFSISPREKQQVLSLLEHVDSFQDFLERFPDRFNSLEGRMRETADGADDILEYYAWGKATSSSDGENELQLEKVMGEIELIAGEVEKIKGKNGSNDVRRGAADSSASSSIARASASAPSTHKDAVVGFEDSVMEMKERLCSEQSELQVIPICGMGGIGKTTLARNVYEDPLIVETFAVRVWITVSQDYRKEIIFSILLDSLKGFDTGKLKGTDEEKVYKILVCRKYLVVLDDIWCGKAWDDVRNAFPDSSNESRILLTTRLSDVASYPKISSKPCEMHLMDGDQSWILFKKKVFENEECPSELENTGKEIARSCGGLPLAIVVIAGLLSTVSRNLASWQEIAKNVKAAAQNQIEDILSLSYFQLPQRLRPCFLYMGYFQEDEEINVTKLIRVWEAEGFVKYPRDSDNFERVAEKCLEELVKRNLILVRTRKWDGRIRSCVLHDMMRDLCIRKAHESKFILYTMDGYIPEERFIESIKCQRRLVVDPVNATHLLSPHSSTIHSIKCSRYGIVKFDFAESVRLLRVLDTEASDVEYSPLTKQLGELFQLRYLAINYFLVTNISLSNLQNLQTLIIGREKRAKFVAGMDIYLVLEWCMPQLRHVYFYDTIIFDDPKETTCFLGSLQTVSSVSHECCTERILKKIPNLKKLKVDCSGGFGRGQAACLNDLVHLHRLEHLQVYAGSWVQSRPQSYSFTFPRMLKKLVLRELILPWNDIVVAGSLPYLQVLKLKECRCVGGTWETTEGEFPQLEFLLIEACYFWYWITESSHFPKLRHLLLHSCGSLIEIPNDIGEIPTLELIEVKREAKDSLVKSAKAIQQEQEEYGNNTLQVIFHKPAFMRW